MEPSHTSVPQPAPLRVGDAVRRANVPRSRETGIVKAIKGTLVTVYWHGTGHRVTHAASSLVATGERVAPKAGPR